MASFNKITIVGYLGRDPELRYTPQGTPVCDFSVATTEKRKDKAGEFQDLTTWFKVTFWGRLAEVANQYLSKGKQVYIEGRLTQREWQDREGTTRTSLDVTGSDLQFIGARSEDGAPAREERASGAGAGSRQPSVREEPADGITEDDVPF